MRWLWLDRILELDKAERCVAIRNVTAAEDVLHDHFAAARFNVGGFNGGPTGCAPDAEHPAYPVMPNSLIIEGFAQTAGILTGHANDFKEKVILAKIGKATLHRRSRDTPGYDDSATPRRSPTSMNAAPRPPAKSTSSTPPTPTAEPQARRDRSR